MLAIEIDVVATIRLHAVVEQWRKFLRVQRFITGLIQGRRQLDLVERWHGAPAGRVHQHDVVASSIVVAIPEVGVVQPFRVVHVVIDQRRNVVAHEALSLRVVMGAQRLILRSGSILCSGASRQQTHHHHAEQARLANHRMH